MLGKQWLNRYASTDMRGTAVERSQNRQRKLDGVATWYFDYVMESLPLMLQAALLLLGCALSRYLWGIDITVALVAIGVTSSGITLYIFTVIAGTASESCPYQTPGSHAFRYMGPKVQSTLQSAASAFASGFKRTFGESAVVQIVKTNVQYYRPWCSRRKIGRFLKNTVLKIPRALASDVHRLGRAMIRALASFPAGVYHLSPTIAGLFIGFARRVNNRLHGTSSAPSPEQGLDRQTTVLDLRCISWMLQISLDKAVHLSTLKHLVTMATLASFNPTLVADCFGIFIGCITVSDCKVVVIQGSEELATVSAACFLRTFHHLSVTDPTSSVLGDVRRRHDRVFPFGTDFVGLPFYHAMAKILGLANRDPHHVQWDNYRPSTQELTTAARDMAEAVQLENQNTHQKVPRFVLRFALHYLSLYPYLHRPLLPTA